MSISPTHGEIGIHQAPIGGAFFLITRLGVSYLTLRNWELGMDSFKWRLTVQGSTFKGLMVETETSGYFIIAQITHNL
jgi:hypothetical protein